MIGGGNINEGDAQAEALVAQMFTLARRKFGKAVKGYWLYDGEPCPGCGFPIDAMEWKGSEALSLNAFIYRPRGVLIGYLLCGRCAQQIFQAAEKNPRVQTPLHSVIEGNLIRAYQRFLGSKDA
jgi:hypothetical protein